MLDLESKLESAQRKVQLANRTKNKVTKEYEKLKAELSHYLAPDQLISMAKNFRGSLWSEGTIRKALKVRLACGSRGYILVKKSSPLCHLNDPEKHVIDVGEVHIEPAKTVDLNSEEVLGVSADLLTDTPE
ncbi:hypothetical protein MRX96_038823 [Rhipicephalus microplus]